MPSPKTARENGKLGGRPRGSLGKTALIGMEIRKQLAERVRKQYDKLMKAKMDLALGHLVQDINEDGQQRIYEKSPDGKAIEYLFDQTIGKAAQKVEVSEVDGMSTSQEDIYED